MGLGATGLTLLCWVVSGGVSFNPWEFSAQNQAPWPRAQPIQYGRQHYNPSWSPSDPWGWVDASQARALSASTPVSMQCGEAQVVVSVKRDLFGTGRLIQAADLSLGSSGCKHSSLSVEDDAVIFEAGLHECGSTLQMTPDSLIYSISLYYKPTTPNNAVVIRTNPAEVPIECHYPRKSNVSSKAIKPTWVPFSSTLSAEQKLSFSLSLMNDDWSAERLSNGYQLGDVLNIQANVNGENHVALRLFVDDCVATLSPERDSSPQYAIIDYNGCLVDGRSDSSSTFLSPRVKEDSLRFTVEVFRFTRDPRDLIYITCHLKVTAVDQAPDPVRKACSFSKTSNTWIPVEGTRDICSCCETGNCRPTVGQSGRVNPWDRWARGRRVGRDVPSHDKEKREVERDVTVGPIFILDAFMASRSSLGHQSHALEATAEQGSFATPALVVGLALMSVAMVLALTLVILLLIKKHSGAP